MSCGEHTAGFLTCQDRWKIPQILTSPSTDMHQLHPSPLSLRKSVKYRGIRVNLNNRKTPHVHRLEGLIVLIGQAFDYRSNMISIRCLDSFFRESDKWILEFKWDFKGLRKAKGNLEKNRVQAWEIIQGKGCLPWCSWPMFVLWHIVPQYCQEWSLCTEPGVNHEPSWVWL